MSNLKEQALLERIGELTVMYENKIADLRVELTKNVQAEQQRAQQPKQTYPVQQPDVVVSSVVE